MQNFKQRLATLLLLAGAVSSFSSVTFAQPQLSGSPDELRGFLFPRPNTVNISGEAELTAYKDIARVSLLVSTEARSLNQAMAMNQELRSSLIEQFVGAGIAAEDINNSKFASSPQYGLFGRNPSSYEVSARLDVEVASEQFLQLLAAAADEHDEVEFESVEFEHSAEEDFETQVRELALADVMEQKSFYEDTLNLELRAINFFYGGIRQMARAMPMAMAMQEMAVDTVGGLAASSIASASAVAPSFDEVEYQTSVTVVFEIVSENSQ